jgi:hypothetical protein
MLLFYSLYRLAWLGNCNTFEEMKRSAIATGRKVVTLRYGVGMGADTMLFFTAPWQEEG